MFGSEKKILFLWFGYKSGWFFHNSGKFKKHVYSLTPISNFHGFSIEITENHVFSTLVKKNLVFPRSVEISTLVATLDWTQEDKEQLTAAFQWRCFM